MARVKDLWAAYPERRGRGKRWLAVWIDPTGRERSKAFAKKLDAERHATAKEVDAARGVYVDERAGRVTLESYVRERWLPAQVHLRPNTIDTYRSHLETHILPVLGGRRIGSIGRSEIKAYVASLAGKLASARSARSSPFCVRSCSRRSMTE